MGLINLHFFTSILLTSPLIHPAVAKPSGLGKPLYWEVMDDMYQISRALTRNDFVYVLIKAIDLRFDMTDEEVDFLTGTILNALLKLLNTVHPIYNMIFPKTKDTEGEKHLGLQSVDEGLKLAAGLARGFGKSKFFSELKKTIAKAAM